MRRRVHRVIAAFALALSLGGACTAVQAQEWNLGALLQAIARNSGEPARFVERKFIAALDAPVDSSGRLQFTRPSRLEKRTLKPREETLIVDGDQLTIERGGSRRTMSMQQAPQAAALIESLRATLAGDRGALESVFTVRLKGAAADWTMTMQPNSEQAAQVVREVRISGAQGDVQLIEIDQRNGDRSVMRVLRGAQ